MWSETDPELIQMLELAVKDFKPAVYKHAQEHKEKHIHSERIIR